MSIELPSHGNNPDEFDPLSNLHIGQLDPVLDDILAKIREAQKTIQDDDEDTIEENASSFSDLFEEMGWLGDTVEVTGKLRISEWSSDREFPVELLTKYGLTIQEDARGQYVDVDDAKLLCAAPYTEVSDRNDGTGTHDLSAYVLSFFTADELKDASKNKRSMSDMLANGGKLIMYPDDLDQMEFSSPSVAQIERFLQAHYPKVLNLIEKVVSKDMGRSGERILRDLKQLTIPRDLEMSAQTRTWIGGYIYSRIDVDEEAEYEFTLNGTIEGLSRDQKKLESLQVANEKLRGVISALTIDEETLRVRFVVAELSAGGVGYEGRFIPIDSTIKLRNLRSMRQRFGELTMASFDYPQDLAEQWHEWTEGAAETGANESAIEETVDFYSFDFQGQSDSTNADEVSDNDILAALDSEFSDQPLVMYNEQYKFYETQIDDEVLAITKVYLEHRVALRELSGDNDRDNAIMSGALENALNRDSSIRRGDEIITSGQAIVIRPEEESLDRSIEIIQPGERVKGKMVALVETEFPTQRMIASEGKIHETERSLGMILEDAAHLTDENKIEKYDESHIVVRISNARTTHFSRIDHDLPPAETSL